MGHMRYEDVKPYEDWFWEKNRIQLKKAHVDKVDFDSKSLSFSGGGQLKYDKLIFATGSSPNKFGWPGQDLDGVGGLYSLQDLERMEKYSKDLKRAVIVGGGLIGIEMAEMFHTRNIPVTFLVRESSFWGHVLPPEESEMIRRHIVENHIDLRLETELKEVVDNGNGQCNAVITNKGEKIECGFVGLTAGVSPNVRFLKESGLEIDRGILVNDYLETNIKDVYAIGDCARIREPQPGRRPIEAIWYTGRMMGETVAYNIVGKKVKYNPGIWFNSAKFFEIEYQVYGNLQANPPENHQAIYWEHSDGRKSIRIVYDKDTSKILGFNLMGVRYRHEVCEKWVHDQVHIEEVLKNLGLANFDPEFYDEYEQEVVNQYQKQSGKQIQLNQKRSLTKTIQFLRNKLSV